eukprot:CAMPEP_0171160256 /NCGR_PEP_ID=MMETSP0790-20130122/3460_1 /TAXON_ID=2925 /ORGANISM="Alexandrium catenella, Strain OF101" /LENGTH=578 /DNA_ID=CAMNT_0011624777 /DNA_START=71 /DNA_END=1807 /DNA_ORIENTATION=-
MAASGNDHSAMPGGLSGVNWDRWLTAGGLAVGAAAWSMRKQGADSGVAFGTVALLAVGPVAYAALTWLLGFLLPAKTLDATTEAKAKSATGAASLGSKAGVSEENTSKTSGAPEGADAKQPKTSASTSAGASQAGCRAGGLLTLFYSWGWLPNPNRWKPFPWNWLPDPVAWLWGLLEILFIAPIAAVCIGVVVPTMVVLKAIWRHPRCAALRSGIPELVRCFSRPLGRALLKDARNHSYIPWMLFLGTFTPALFFWAMRRHSTHGLEFSTLVIYHILRIGPRFQFFAHAHTIVHKAGHDHKGFFRAPFECLNGVVEWWITPFYGVVPNNYSIAHMKIHHRWHNDVDDVHTNLDLDRTVLGSFLIYTPRFTLYWTGLSPIALLIKRKEWLLLRELVSGMVVYYGATLALLYWNPVFCVVYWIYPHMEACVLLCAISYLWHAFVEESDPGNQYVNSVTILEGHDNVWNEDYHVVHHHAPGCHWTDAPAHFEAHREQYAAVNATIFRDTEEGMLLKWMFEKNFDKMAEHFVDLNNKLTREEKKALIMRRLRVIIGETGRDGKRIQRDWAATETIRTFESDK